MKIKKNLFFNDNTIKFLIVLLELLYIRTLIDLVISLLEELNLIDEFKNSK